MDWFFVHDGFMKRWCWSVSGRRVCSVAQCILQLQYMVSGAAAMNEIFVSLFDMWVDAICGCTSFYTISHMMWRYCIVHFMYPAYKYHMTFE